MEDTDPYLPAYDRRRLIQLSQTSEPYSSTEAKLQEALKSPRVQRDIKSGKLVSIILATSKIPILR